MELHPPLPDSTSHLANNSTPVVEDCEGQPASPSRHTNPTPPNSKETPTKKSNKHLLSRCKSAGVRYEQPRPHYYHGTPPKQRASPLHPTVGVVTGSPPTRPSRHLKQTTPKHRVGNDKSPIDLTVTSARMVMSSTHLIPNTDLILMNVILFNAPQIPVSRPCQWREANKRVQRGGPSSLASGTYTQTYGSIKHTDLQRLAHARKTNNW